MTEAFALLAGWQPHLVVLDMDTEGSAILDRLADASRKAGGAPPVIALTRRANLEATLAAFDQRGVDDITDGPPFITRGIRGRACGRHHAAQLPRYTWCSHRFFAWLTWRSTS